MRGKISRVISADCSRPLPVSGLASIHLALGNIDQAIEGLEKAFQERDATLFWLRFSPGYEAHKNDPRIQDLLRRMHLAP